MNKIDNSNITSSVLQPFTKTTWDYLQKGIEQMLLALAKCVSGIPDSAGSDVVLFGCVNSGGGGSWVISEGWIYDTSDQQEELFYVSQFTHHLVGGEVPVLVEDFSWDSGDPIQFSDGNVHNVHAFRALKWQMGTPGSGIQDFGNLIRLKTLGLGEPAWINCTMLNNWVGSGWFSPAFSNARYKKDNEGWICLDGGVGGGASVYFNTIAFNLPSGYRPTYEKWVTVNDNNGNTFIVDILPSGNVIINPNSSANFLGTICLAVIRFRLD